jgi:hypothetical protein
MSDQKKCGITFPLQLVEVLIEELERMYPEVDLRHWRGFLNAYVYIDGEGAKIRNGLGIGMGNEIVSFLVSCIFELWSS